MPKIKLLEWSPQWDLSTVPWDVLVAAYSKQRGAKARNPGRKRSCGHAGQWVRSCPVCLENYKRTERRRVTDARKEAAV